MSAEPETSTLTDGFHLVVDALKLNGIDTIYGVAGIPITDLARLAQSEGMRYFGFRHETSAGNAAAIAGFLTQKPGVCLTVSAPGFLNGMVALANATTNCFPMILISGSSNRAIVDLEQGEYEELDQMNAAKPFAKAAYRVDRPEDIGLGVARAIRTAVSGRPGGVYLDLTGEMLGATLDAEAGRKSLVQGRRSRATADSGARRDRARARRAGESQAAAHHPRQGGRLRAGGPGDSCFIESTGIPFLPMSMAKGLLPDDHPQSAAAARSFAIGQADVVMLIGARLNWLLSQRQSAALESGHAVCSGRHLADRDRQQPRHRRAGCRRHQVGHVRSPCGTQARPAQAERGVASGARAAQAEEHRSAWRRSSPPTRIR